MASADPASVNNDFVVQPLPTVEEVQPNPVAAIGRALRGRWKTGLSAAAILVPALTALGYLSGVQLYESNAILRVYPQESNILYATGESSVLKIFDSFVKAETSLVASHPVMERSATTLTEIRPDLENGVSASDLSRSIEVRRSDSLILLKTKSKDAAFAAQKLDAVISSYFELKSEAEELRTSVRLEELYSREQELVARLDTLRSDQLEIGGEFGLNALAKAHIEKIAQIDSLSSRQSEVAATLAALQLDDVSASADTSDQEIMRATMLDRAMADLNFERAKLMSELAGLQSEYVTEMNPRYERTVKAKREEILVIETAMANRREQIRVLGQTGALTDASESGDDTTIKEIEALYEKVSGKLNFARQEARDLNRRRIDLDRIESELNAASSLLGETRRALEVIRLEFGRALPGYAEVMTPPSRILKPTDDTSKMKAATGCLAGLVAAMALMSGMAIRERHVRFAESLKSFEIQLPVRQVTDLDEKHPHAADLLRNELQMQNLRKPRLVGSAPVVVLTNAGASDSRATAFALAESFARARMKTLFIDADITQEPAPGAEAGWRELLAGASVEAPVPKRQPALWEVDSGSLSYVGDRTVSAPMVRDALQQASRMFDVVIVSVGALQDSLSAQFALTSADVCVLVLSPKDSRVSAQRLAEKLHSLPRNGSVVSLRNALPNDPWLAVRT